MTDPFGRGAHLSGVPEDTDPFVMWDAAYVLGALSSTERRQYEAHLTGCRPCRSAVAEFSGMPALLAMLRPEEVDAIDHGGLRDAVVRRCRTEIRTLVRRARRLVHSGSH